MIKQGLGGVTLSLPIKWIRDHNLEGGDEIEIKEINEGLLLSVEGKKERKEISISLTAKDESSIRDQLNDLYRLGYDQITINYTDKKQVKLIEKIITSRLLGFEKTLEDEKKILIESVTEPNDEKEQVLLRRMFLLIKESFSLVEDNLKSGKLTCLEEIKTMNTKIGLYDNFNKRNIYKKRMVEARVNFYWNLYTDLLLIHQSLLHLVEGLNNKPLRFSNNSLNYFYLISTYFNSVYDAFFKNDIKSIRETSLQLKELLYQKIQISLLKSSGTESLLLYYLGELSRLVYLTTMPISSIIV